MIIKLHGTSGAGKSTVARELMRDDPSPEELPYIGNRPSGYRVIHPQLTVPLFILGPYMTNCGGLDALGEADDHIELLVKYGHLGHVFYEGLLQSGFYGRIGKASEQFGDDHIFAFLDTPLDLCLARVQARRLSKGVTKPLNPENTIDKHRVMWRLKERLEKGIGCPIRKTAVVHHDTPVEDVLALLKGSV